MQTYLGATGLAEALGVTRHAVHKWRQRYPASSAHPFPEPDVDVDGAPGWAPGRVPEVLHWREGLPGRGFGGGRPSAARREFLEEAGRRGFTLDEAERMVTVFVAEFPERTEAQIHEWLLTEWRT